MDIYPSDNMHIHKSKIGRRKLRLGSLTVIGIMLFYAIFSLYFVTTAKPEIGEYAIKPKMFLIILVLCLPVLIWGIFLMVKGFRMETRGYIEDLKEAENQLHRILSSEKNVNN